MNELMSVRCCETISDIVRVHAESNPSVAALVGIDGRQLDGGQLQAQIFHLRSALVAYVGEQDRVVMILPSGLAAAIAFLAISSSSICMPLNPNCSSDEIEFFLNEVGAKAFVTSAGSNDAGRDVAQRLGIKIFELQPSQLIPGLLTFGESCDAVDEERTRSPRPDSFALLLHTSGTTGRPKIVKLSHKNLIHAAQNIGAALNLSTEDRCLNVMPLFHAHGIVGGLLAPLAAGGASICAPAFRSENFFPWLGATRPTWYTAVPTIHRAIARAASEDSEALRCSCLRLVRSCSAALDERLFADLQQTIHGARHRSLRDDRGGPSDLKQSRRDWYAKAWDGRASYGNRDCDT